MVRRWTSEYWVEWTPILTFTRRRLELLNWLDANVEPVAFTEEPDHVGVAIVARDLRLMVRRDGVQVLSGAHGADLELLGPALQGVFDVMQPKGAVVESVATMTSVEVLHEDYNEARSRFAAQLGSFRSGNVGGYRWTDASALADLDTAEVQAQVEWGVVERDELFFRLANPSVGRLSSVSPRRNVSAVEAIRRHWGEEAPAVSLLADVQHRRKVGGRVADAGDVLARGAELDAAALDIAAALHDGLWPQKEDGRELA